jgi:hypothetical protein
LGINPSNEAIKPGASVLKPCSFPSLTTMVFTASTFSAKSSSLSHASNAFSLKGTVIFAPLKPRE